MHQGARRRPGADRGRVPRSGAFSGHHSHGHGSSPFSRALLVRLSERPAEIDLAVIDADVEATLGIAAYPCLVRDGSAIPAVVAHRQEFAVSAFSTLRQLDVLHHKSSPGVAHAAHAAA